MAQIVGLDIGTRTIVGAVFTGGNKRFRLTDFFVEDVPTLEEAAESAGGGEIVPPSSLGEVLHRVFQEKNLLGADVVASIEARDCILREIPVPFTKDEHIRKTILSEVENHFQTIDVDDVILEYHKIEEIGDKSRILIAAARKSIIQGRLDLLRQAGLDPVALDLDAAALFNAFALTPTFDPERTTLLIDMGGTTTKVLLVEKGQLKKVRSIRMDSYLGGSSRLIGETKVETVAARAAALPAAEGSSIEARFLEIESALRRLDPLSSEEASVGLAAHEEPIAILTDEEFDLVRQVQPEPAPASFASALPPSPGSREGKGPGDGKGPRDGKPPHDGKAPHDGKVKGANGGPVPPAGNGAAPRFQAGRSGELNYRGYLERLGTELQRTLATASTDSDVQLICLTGGLSREEACRYFSDEFDVETIRLDFGDSFPTDLSKEAHEEVSRAGAVAVGLAIKELGSDRLGFDFRKKEFRFERRFERVKYPVLCAGILTFLVFVQLAFSLYNTHWAYTDKIQAIQRKEREMYKAFFGFDNTSPLLFPQAEQQKKKWVSLLGVGGQNIPVFVPAVEGLDEVSRALKEVGNLHVESIDLKLRTRTMAKGKINPEDSSLSLNSNTTGLGTDLEKFFGKPGMVFSARSSENRNPQTGVVKMQLKLTPQERFLLDLRK